MERSEQSMGPFVAHTDTNIIRIWYRAGLENLNDPRRLVARIYANESASHKEEKEFNFLNNYDHIGLIEFGTDCVLEEDTTYIYRIGFIDHDERFLPFSEDSVKTFSEDLNKSISFICGSCRHLYVNHANGGISSLENLDGDVKYGDRAFRSIYESADGLPDLMIMTGDQVYCDHEEGSIVSTNPAKTIEEYYDNYYRAYQQPYFSKLGSKIPFFMSMDDHEIKNDWHMDMIMNTYNGYTDNRVHYENGVKSYLAYQASLSSVISNVTDIENNLDKLSNVSYEISIEEGESPYEDTTKGLFYKYSHGPAKFFSLDVRAERYMGQFSPQMIGEMQKQALEEWLLENRDDEYVKFIITAVPMFPDTKNVFFYPFGAPEDKWGGFCEQRIEILDFIRTNNIRKVVFVSGDVHVSLFSTLLYNNQDIGVYSIISSGLSWPVPGLQRFNFDWKNIPKESIYRSGKRVPNTATVSYTHLTLPTKA